MASTLWARYPGSEEPFLLGDEKTNDAHSVRPEPGGELHARSPRSPLTCRRSSTASSSMGCGTRSRDAEPGKVPLGARGSGSSPRTQLQPSFFPGSLYSGLLLVQFFSRCTYLWFHWRLSCPRGQANISASSHKIKKNPTVDSVILKWLRAKLSPPLVVFSVGWQPPRPVLRKTRVPLLQVYDHYTTRIKHVALLDSSLEVPFPNHFTVVCKNADTQLCISWELFLSAMPKSAAFILLHPMNQEQVL